MIDKARDICLFICWRRKIFEYNIPGNSVKFEETWNKREKVQTLSDRSWTGNRATGEDRIPSGPRVNSYPLFCARIARQRFAVESGRQRVGKKAIHDHLEQKRREEAPRRAQRVDRTIKATIARPITGLPFTGAQLFAPVTRRSLSSRSFSIYLEYSIDESMRISVERCTTFSLLNHFSI